MAIEIEKPAPMEIDGRYIYSLTSYDPVTVVVDVPYITDQDVIIATRQAVSESNPENKELDDAWVKEHMEGMETLDQLYQVVRQQLERMNMQYVEDQKRNKCVMELTDRLVQAVPESEIKRMEQTLLADLQYSLSQQGISEEDFRQSLSDEPNFFNDMLNEQATAICTQAAALDAYASEKKIDVTDSEIPMFLGLNEEQFQAMKEEAIKANVEPELKINAIRNKAAVVLVSEANITYHHETKEEALARIAQQNLQQYEQAKKDGQL